VAQDEVRVIEGAWTRQNVTVVENDVEVSGERNDYCKRQK
jgi:hypothetical protein